MLWYLRARNYDPATGRFTQRDPFAGVGSSPVTLHDYLYAGNDPVMNTDPGGQFFSAGGGMVSASISGALRGMQIYSNANVAISFMRSLAAGDTEGAVEQAGMGLLYMLGPVAFSRYAVTYGNKLAQNRTFAPLIACSLRNSFTGDTLVQTTRGLIPIKDVRIGDKVLSFDEKTGKFVEQPVVHLIQREKTEEYVILGLDNGETIEATVEHPFYVGGKWTEVKDLTAGDLLTTTIDKSVKVKSVRSENRRTTAYNLEIANTHTYTITRSGIVVHNANTDCGRFIPFAAIGKTVDDLSRTGRMIDPADASGQLTRAGRALQKHGAGSRAGGGAYPHVSGGPAAINRQGQDVLDDLLTAPGAVVRKGNRFGVDAYDVVAPDGRGARFDAAGIFRGFLEP